MSSRGPLGWYLGFVLVVVVPIVLAAVLIWIASGQQILVNEFYTSQNSQISDEDYRYWDTVQRSSYMLTTVAAPTLFTGASAAVFGLLAVLAFRWERKPVRPAQDVAGATAAS